ncbi:hypothetical protein [Castellaniella defragrans]|uniref:hypothetical protein n=1 Tax=Castellaniella defragrans TaxID=75697 RepID=UPI002AFE4EEC|nr:hypothetical protein [Castellaniella defragrans]
MPEIELSQAQEQDALLAAIENYQQHHNPESYASISQALAAFESTEANLTPAHDTA